MKYEKEFREAHPETIGETDYTFDITNYNEWLEKRIEAMKCCGNCGIEKSNSECNIESILRNGTLAFICDNWQMKDGE